MGWKEPQLRGIRSTAWPPGESRREVGWEEWLRETEEEGTRSLTRSNIERPKKTPSWIKRRKVDKRHPGTGGGLGEETYSRRGGLGSRSIGIKCALQTVRGFQEKKQLVTIPLKKKRGKMKEVTRVLQPERPEQELKRKLPDSAAARHPGGGGESEKPPPPQQPNQNKTTRKKKALRMPSKNKESSGACSMVVDEREAAPEARSAFRR